MYTITFLKPLTLTFTTRNKSTCLSRNSTQRNDN